MNILLPSILLGISTIFPALTVTGRSVPPPVSQYIIPRYQSLPLFSRISRSDIPRTLLLKNFLELDCIRQLYNGDRKSRNRFGPFRNQGQLPRGPLFRYRGNAFNNRRPGFRQNQIQRVNHSPGDGKFLLTPVSYSTINQPPPLNYSKNWKPMSPVVTSSKVFFRPNFKEEINIARTNEKENSINAKADTSKIKMENGLRVGEKEEFMGEEKFRSDKHSSMSNNENQQFFKENNNKLKFVDAHQAVSNPVPLEKSKVPPHSYQVSRPKIIHPYEVEEIIEEDIRVDVKNEKEDDLQNLNIDQPTAYNNDIELINDEPETSSQRLPNNAMEGLDNSISKILKGLILPPSAKEKTTKEVNGNKGDMWDKKIVTIIPPVFGTTAPKYFLRNFYNENENVNQVEVAFESNKNSDNRAKSLVLKNERKNLMQNASSTSKKSDIWRVHPVGKYDFTESYSDSNDWKNENRLKTLEEKRKKFLNSRDSTELDTTIQLADLFNFNTDSNPPKTEIPLLSLPELFSYPLYPENIKEHMIEDVIQLPNLQPNDSLYGEIFLNSPNDDEDLSNEVMPTTPKPFTNEKNTEESEITTTTVKIMDQSEWSSGEAEVVKPGLPEWDQTITQLQVDSNEQNKDNLTEPEETSEKSTEIKVTFDPIPETSKSEDVNPDAGFKNSRKMHYDPDVDNSLDEETSEQRRSDILINEAVKDYDENVKESSAKKYLKVLEESISEKNFSIDSVVPNIASIINDLREGSLSPDEILLVSKATGKYWPSILTLSNSTNFDMLPLLKMKTESDLEQFLENSLKDDAVEKTTLESVYDLTNDMNYEYDYKDMYQDIAVEDLGFKRKKKFRPTREIDNHLEHVRTKKSFFYRPGNEDIIEKTESHIRIKRNREHDWKAEATQEYFESLEKERNENDEDSMYDEVLYSDLAEDNELIQAELVEATDLQMSFQNMTSSLLNK